MQALRCYYKQTCHLCDDMFVQLQPLIDAGEISVEKVEISDDEALLNKWGEFIPVLAHLDDTVICQYFFDPDALNY